MSHPSESNPPGEGSWGGSPAGAAPYGFGVGNGNESGHVAPIGFPQSSQTPGQPGANYPPAGAPQQPYSPQHYPQQPYAQQPYAQQPYAQQPYPHSGAPGSGYGYPGTAYQPGQPLPAFPAPMVKPAVPSSVRASSVLAFIQAGFNLILGIITLSGTSELSDVPFTGAVTGEITVMSILAILSGGLLIAGGVQALSKRTTLLLIGASLSIALSLWWAIRFNEFSVVLVWALLLSVMPILSIAMVNNATAKSWINQKV
jgi:hypothetical protein